MVIIPLNHRMSVPPASTPLYSSCNKGSHPTLGEKNSVYKTVRTARLYEQIVQQIEESVLKGALKPGDQLPAERELAEHFGVSPGVVYYWIERSLVQTRRLNRGMPYWITLNGSDEQKLLGWVRNSTRIQKGKAFPNATGEGAL